ncbi:MAG: hypothetical protein H0V40_03110 [Actinobacteria bacterium]|nr:hypothetical protein [Actinomycetota bacterium]
MSTTKLELPDELEEERIIRWRLSELTRAGYDWPASMSIAARPDIDLHAAVALLRRGCPTQTALRILL